MSWLTHAFDAILHLDRSLGSLIQSYGAWTYAILFLIIFAETGLVVTPFLPGDSLLFATGAFAATGALDVSLVFLLLSVAAILGDTVNYWIGRKLGTQAFLIANGRLIKQEHLLRTQRFYERHGGKTIVLARFVPIIRTFAPFVAGIGRMEYGKFLFYNVTGGLVWIAIFVFGGYFFGNLPFVKENFSLVIFAIIAVSILPGLVEFLRHRRAAREAEHLNADGTGVS